MMLVALRAQFELSRAWKAAGRAFNSIGVGHGFCVSAILFIDR